MFSAGHLIWIAISAVLIVTGDIPCKTSSFVSSQWFRALSYMEAGLLMHLKKAAYALKPDPARFIACKTMAGNESEEPFLGLKSSSITIPALWTEQPIKPVFNKTNTSTMHSRIVKICRQHHYVSIRRDCVSLSFYGRYMPLKPFPDRDHPSLRQ